MARVWLAVAAVVVVVATTMVAAVGEQRTRGTTGRAGTVVHGGGLVKAELRAAFPNAAHGGRIGTVGHGTLSHHLPGGTTGRVNKPHHDMMRVTAARGVKLGTDGRSIPLATTSHSHPRGTTAHTGTLGTVTQRAAPNTRGGSLSKSPENRTHKRGVTSEEKPQKPIDLQEAAKLAASIDRAIPIDLSKYATLDQNPLLSLANRGPAISLFMKAGKSQSEETSNGAKKKSVSQEKPKSANSKTASTASPNGSRDGNAKGGNKREIVEVLEIDDLDDVFLKGDSTEFFDSRERSPDLFGIVGPSGGLFRDKSNNRGRVIELRVKGDTGLLGGGRTAASNLRGIFDKGNSRERSRGLFGKGGGRGLDIFGIFNKGNSRERPGGLFGKGGGGGGGGGGGLDIFGLFNKGDSMERSKGLFGKGGGRGLDIFGIFDKGDSRERSGGLFGKGGKGGRGDLDILGIFDSKERYGGGGGGGGLFGGAGLNLLGNKGRGSRGRSDSRESSNERSRGGLFANKGRGGGGLFSNIFDLFGIFNKGSRERSGGLFNKGQREYNDRIELSDAGSRSRERSGGIFRNKGTRGGLFGGGGKGLDIFGLFNKGSRERSSGLFGKKGQSRARSGGRYGEWDDSRERSGLLGGIKGPSDDDLFLFQALDDLHDIIWGR